MGIEHRPVVSELPLASSSGLVGVADSPKVICTSPSVVMTVIGYTDGSNDVTVTVYDNATEASGTELSCVRIKGEELMGGETQMYRSATNGIVVKIEGVGGKALLAYFI